MRRGIRIPRGPTAALSPLLGHYTREGRAGHTKTSDKHRPRATARMAPRSSVIEEWTVQIRSDPSNSPAPVCTHTTLHDSATYEIRADSVQLRRIPSRFSPGFRPDSVQFGEIRFLNLPPCRRASAVGAVKVADA